MKKEEIKKIVEANKHRRTKTLKSVISELGDIVHDREITRGMWFWSDNGNRSERNRKERRYARDVTVEMKGLTVRYIRDVAMSRANVYVDESLYGITADKEEIWLTVADIKKLRDGFIAICEQRGAA